MSELEEIKNNLEDALDRLNQYKNENRSSLMKKELLSEVSDIGRFVTVSISKLNGMIRMETGENDDN